MKRALVFFLAALTAASAIIVAWDAAISRYLGR